MLRSFVMSFVLSSVFTSRLLHVATLLETFDLSWGVTLCYFGKEALRQFWMKPWILENILAC
jgi:hypothetical protein